MGGANNICSDKTGTLTMNKMTVTNIFVGVDKPVKVVDPQYQWADYLPNELHRQLFIEAISCNTSGSVEHASATEQAMLIFMNKIGENVNDHRAKHMPENYVRFQFTSKRKRMSTIIHNCGKTEHGYDRRVHMKGAAEIVLDECSFYLNDQGQKTPLTDSVKQNFLKTITVYASQSLRTISFAYRDLKSGEGGPEHNLLKEGDYLYEVEKGGYTLVGIIGIKDVIRPEVPLAVERCQKAGIMVRMVTGDNLITAKAIARECGILTDELANLPDSVMEGPQFFDRMGGIICRNCKQKSPCDCDRKDVREGVKNLESFKSVAKNLRVLARSRPEDKYLLVTGLKELGEVVAVTGDGTNDAPALKKADVGFAMGITGTEIAKHAADIIIMDDNFASIVKACMWGRNVYDNIRKFLQFQITVSLVALFTAFIGSVVLQDSPL
jgi:Ca2+ transporting ATPase